MGHRLYNRASLKLANETADALEDKGEQPENLLGREQGTKGIWVGSKTIRYRYQNRELTIDRHAIPVWRNYIPTTRIRIPYIEQGDFLFSLQPKTIFSGLSKTLLLFCKAISVGYGVTQSWVGKPAQPAMEVMECRALGFTDRFMVKANNTLKARSLFSNSDLRGIIESQAPLFLENYKYNNSGENCPSRVNVLSVSVVGTIADWQKLKPLCDLASYTLDSLRSIGAACEDPTPPSA